MPGADEVLIIQIYDNASGQSYSVRTAVIPRAMYINKSNSQWKGGANAAAKTLVASRKKSCVCPCVGDSKFNRMYLIPYVNGRRIMDP